MKKYRLTGYLNYNGILGGDSDSCLAISENSEIFKDNLVIAEFFENELDGKQIRLNYFISDKEIPREELEEQYLKKISGLVDASIYPVYSDVTGYLWTEESCVVGGHNLYEELSNYVGKYLDMAIEVMEEK